MAEVHPVGSSAGEVFALLGGEVPASGDQAGSFDALVAQAAAALALVQPPQQPAAVPVPAEVEARPTEVVATALLALQTDLALWPLPAQSSTAAAGQAALAASALAEVAVPGGDVRPAPNAADGPAWKAAASASAAPSELAGSTGADASSGLPGASVGSEQPAASAWAAAAPGGEGAGGVPPRTSAGRAPSQAADAVAGDAAAQADATAAETQRENEYPQRPVPVGTKLPRQPTTPSDNAPAARPDDETLLRDAGRRAGRTTFDMPSVSATPAAPATPVRERVTDAAAVPTISWRAADPAAAPRADAPVTPAEGFLAGRVGAPRAGEEAPRSDSDAEPEQQSLRQEVQGAARAEVPIAGHTSAGIDAPTPAGLAEQGAMPRPALFGQVVRAVQMLHARGQSEVYLRLDPPELGELHIRLAVAEEQVHVHVRTASSEVKGLLDAGLGQLRQALADLGLRVEGLQISLGQGGSYGFGAESGGAPWHGAGAHPSRAGDWAAKAESTPQPHLAVRTSDHAVDYRV